MNLIRSTLAAGLLVFGTAAVASAQTAQAPARQHGQHGQFQKGIRARGGKALFRGITLSDAEKENIKNVHAKYAPQMKALREQFKATGKDSTARLQEREQVRQLM